VLTAKQAIAILENRNISPILLRQIAKDIGLTVEELPSHCKR
jgi:hypothetical protein